MYEQLVRERKEVAQLHSAKDQGSFSVSIIWISYRWGLIRHVRKVTRGFRPSVSRSIQSVQVGQATSAELSGWCADVFAVASLSVVCSDLKASKKTNTAKEQSMEMQVNTTIVDGRWNHTPAVLLSPASPNFNVAFGLRASGRWTKNQTLMQRKLYTALCNIELWGLGFYLVGVCSSFCSSTVGTHRH